MTVALFPQIWLRGTVSLLALLVLAACATATDQSSARTFVRVASWNIEHLGEPGEGCVPRTEIQIAAIRDYALALDVDVISFQEVASEAAALAVFPADEWRLFVSQRLYDRPQPQCRQDQSRTMGHMRTGFAVRRHLVAERRPELAALGDTALRANDEPHGVDLLLQVGSHHLRLLSVHLTSGCRAMENRGPSCAALFSQAPALQSWVEAREASGEAWLIAGDFNRPWSSNDAFWSSALGDQRQTVQVVSSGEDFVDLIVASPVPMGARAQRTQQPASAVALGLSDHEPVVAEIRWDPMEARQSSRFQRGR